MIDGSTRTCGLIGNPVEHTLSPKIHNELAKLYGHNLVYVPFRVKTGELEAAIAGAKALNVLGCNVTVPYKSDVISYVSEIDSLAKDIGAVNTLVEVDNGYKGYNTDMPGLLRAMQSEGIEIKNASVLIFGAGGVARAVAMMSAREQAKEILIVNRSMEKAKKIVAELSQLYHTNIVKAITIEECYQLADHQYIAIQATSVGMYPNSEDAIIREEAIYQKLRVAYDLIFNPKETMFMKLAKEQGIPAYNGLKMLLYQGVIAYELWNKIKVEEDMVEQIYQILLRNN